MLIEESDTLYNAFTNSDKIYLNKQPTENYLIPCCCITDKWCFDHSRISINTDYDEREFHCCTCLDCCTWCLEFKIKNCSICSKKTNLYLCCFTIYFI